jgi:hypothetical protein
MVAIPVPLVVLGPVFPGNKGRVISGGCRVRDGADPCSVGCFWTCFSRKQRSGDLGRMEDGGWWRSRFRWLFLDLFFPETKVG